MKYALLIIFQYIKNPYSDRSLSILPGAIHDLNLAIQLCNKFQIYPQNITIVTDMISLHKKYSDYNFRCLRYPDDELVCREIAQFIENTVRGIEDNIFKSGSEDQEVFFYVSGHGGQIEIDGDINQGILLTHGNGMYKRYLLSTDLFNLLFGNNIITSDGEIKLSTWEKISTSILTSTDSTKSNQNNSIKSIKHTFSCHVTPVTSSPLNSPSIKSKPYRSNYLANRGLPASTKMLILIDTCHSANMTAFPYRYDEKKQKMVSFMNSNIDIYEDLPFCVTIAACSEDQKTKSTYEGSILTKMIYSRLNECHDTLTIGQLYYYLFEYSLPSFWCLPSLTIFSVFPIISSTSNNSDEMIPFFSNKYENEIIIIDK